MNPNLTVTTCSPGSPSSTLYTIHVSDSEDVGKRRRKRTIISAEQLSKLESLYKQEQWPNRERKEKLAKEIGMSTHFVNIWFQNKRSRMKKMAQEEAELACLRKSMSESESQQSQEEPPTSIQSSGNDTTPVTEQVLKPFITSPARATPRPILPSPRKPAQSNLKTVLSDLKLTSPQVVCVKLPLTSQSVGSAASSPDQTAVPKKIKLESNSGKSDLRAGVPLTFPASPVLPHAKPAEYRDIVNMAIKSEILQDKSQTPSGSITLQQTAPENIQKIVVTESESHNKVSTLHQRMAHKLPQIRFACSSSTVMPPLPPGPDRRELVDNQVPFQESNHSSISTATSSHGMTRSLPTAPSYNLFDCLVAMAAIEEGGGIVPRQDPIYDIAVNSALYGIKVDDDMVLTHDKQKGLRFAETEG